MGMELEEVPAAPSPLPATLPRTQSEQRRPQSAGTHRAMDKREEGASNA